MNNSKVTYHQQVSYCGKPRCRKCREGTGHGPYWYAYKTVDGRTSRTYIGKELPAEAREALTGPHEPEPPSAHAEELAQSHIRIYTLGQFRLERRNSRDPQEWQTATDSAWQHQRVRWLLAGLVSQPSRRMGREQLLELLWPDLDLETASSRMDRSVYSLRQIFEPQRAKLAQSPLLLTERELLILGDHPQVWIDADVFEKLIIEAREIGEKDLGKKESLLMEAMSLYGGAFLPELRKSEWTQSRRETLLRSFISLLLDLSDVRSKRDAWQGALEPLNKLLSLDPTNEAAVQRLMMLLFRLERRSEALQAYSRLGGFLKRDFNIAPLPETRAIYEKVRSGTLPDKPPVSNQAEKEQRHIPPLPPTLFGRSHASPLVGRQDEIHLLSGMLKEIETSARFRLPGQKKSIASPLDTQRRPHCVLLMGEVGIGKTRLAEEASREAKRGNWAVAWSRVYSQEGSIPYRIWTEVLRRAMEQGLWQRQEFQRRATILQPLTALLPDLQELFPPSTFNLNQSPEREQLRLWEAALELLTMISENTPLMIALDDLQWADSSSCDLLAYLARRINGYPIFIVGTCRENELTQNHALRPLLTDLLREHAVEQVALLPLEDKEIEALVSHVARLPETMVQQIGERAGGNPFFAEELGRALGAETPSTNGRVVLLPETITAVLDMRLGRLSQECQNMLRKAAILGRSFEFPQIAAMEAGTLDYDDDSADLVLDRLEEALASGMITEEGTGIRITYQFWHPLLVSHLSERLSAARRANLHRRAAEILRHDYRNREEEGAAIITDHLVDGGADRVLIARYSELAGNRSYNLSDFPGAEKYYRIALEHIDEDDSNKLHQTYLYEYLGECTRALGKTEDARVFYQRALNGYNQNLVVSLPDEEQQKAQIIALLYCEIGATWYDMRDNASALQYFERGENVLKEASVSKGAVWAILKLRQCYIFWQEGSYEKTLHNANETLRLFEEVLATQSMRVINVPCSARIARTLSGDPVDLGRTYVLLGSVTDAIGQPSQAVDYLNKALAILEQGQRYREIAIAYCTLGDLYLRKAEFEQAQAAIRNSVTLAEKVGDDALLSIIFCNQGILLARFGDLPEAEICYKKGLLLAEQVNDPVYINILLVSMWTVLQDQGKVSEAEKCLQRALKIGRDIRSNFCIGSALVAIGTMRIYQFLIVDQDQSKKRILRKAHSTLLHALSLEGMEAQTQAEGALSLGYVELLQYQPDLALQRVKQTLEDTLKHELIGLVARSQQLLGCILTAQNCYEDAYKYLEEAKEAFSKRGMRLEYARTLYHFGSTLFQQNLSMKERLRGSSYLREAQQICIECKAALDLQLVERALAEHEMPSTQVI